jgi:hypothetical protein
LARSTNEELNKVGLIPVRNKVWIFSATKEGIDFSGIREQAFRSALELNQIATVLWGIFRALVILFGRWIRDAVGFGWWTLQVFSNCHCFVVAASLEGKFEF